MKFLCDQCKAKYQISDDKVAGKTVRMKCRKCGHLIEVRAAVTETSVTAGVPSEPPPAGAPGQRPPPPKPSMIPKGSLATSLSQAKPPIPRPGAKPEGGLANAFKSQMQTREDEAALLELSSADEWYAAINGVPVGPVRIGELRRKAALGAVTDDSLVWQEGMEEWRPVKTIPELAALVREAATSGRVSLVSPEPPNVRGSVLPPSPSQSMRPGAPRPTPPRPASDRPAAAAARSNVVPFTSRLATAEKLDEAPAASPGHGSPTSERFSIPPDPFAVPPGAAVASAAAAAPPPASAQAPVIVQMPRQPNYIGIGMILAMVAFGGVAAWALFFKPPPAPPQAPTVNTVYLPAPVASVAAPVDTNAAPADSSGAGKVAHNGAVASAKPGPSAKPAIDLKGQGLDLNGLMGPGGGPAGPSGGAGTQLTTDQLSQVVNSHKVGIKRTCVERLGATSAGAVNERVSLTIDGNGHVTAASAAGNNGVVGTCLEKEVRNWSFPPTGATTHVDLPFVFVTQ